jgi:1-acyl-sn-glycerol-3-phosphate acyltransferase
LTDAAIPPADLVPVQREATPMFRFARAVVGPLFRAVFRIEVSGRDKVPARNVIVIANHLNWIDPWLLLLVFPVEPRLHFLANPKNLVKHASHFWFVRNVGGYIPVDLEHGHGPELFKHVRTCLERGGSIGIFPEAAYGPLEGQLQETFKKGFAYFAVESGVPVLPVALSGTKDLWLRKTLRLVIGEPIDAKGREVDTMVTVARERLQALLPQYEEPPGRKPLRKFLTRLLY